MLTSEEKIEKIKKDSLRECAKWKRKIERKSSEHVTKLEQKNKKITEFFKSV